MREEEGLDDDQGSYSTMTDEGELSEEADLQQDVGQSSNVTGWRRKTKGLRDRPFQRRFIQEKRQL